MKRLLQKALGLLTRIISITRFNKLPVFYQIITIVILGLGFFAAQAYLNDRTLNRILASEESDEASEIYQLARVKYETASLQTAYLEALLEKASTTKDAPVKLTRIVATLGVTQSIPEETKADMLQRLEAVKGLLEEAPTEALYAEIRPRLLNVTLQVDSLYDMETASAAQESTGTTRYLRESRRTSIVMLLITAAVSTFLGLVIAYSISNPLRRIVEATGLLATGDLTQNIEAGGSREISAVVRGLNQAIGGLRELVQKIHEQSTSLFSASEELKGASAETGKAASEVALTIGKVAQGASEQAGQITQAVGTIQSVSATIQKVKNDTEQLATTSESISNVAGTGLSASKAMMDEIQAMYSSTQEVDGVIADLNEASEEIDRTSEMIKDIADQTGLLALNASIEAARAGEHGRGFGVVAQETGKLAEQSKDAAKQISGLIEDIKKKADRAVAATGKGTVRAEQGKKLAADTQGTFGKIFQLLSGISSQIDTVAQSTGEMTDSNRAMTDSIDLIAAVSKQSLQSTEDVSAMTEQQSASMQQVSSMAESLFQIANSLQGAVTAFKIQA